MWRLIRFLFWLALLAAIGLVAYAMIADLPPPSRQYLIDLPMPDAPAE